MPSTVRIRVHWVCLVVVSLTAAAIAHAQSWAQLAPAGPLPVGRDFHSAVYNASSNRMIVFGGRDAPGRDLPRLERYPGAPPIGVSCVQTGAPPIQQMDRRNANAARNQLEAFINEVQALMRSDRLPQAKGAEWTAAASEIIGHLG